MFGGMGTRTIAGAVMTGLLFAGLSGVAGAKPGKSPDPPTDVTAQALGGATKVRWAVPADPGSDPITGYTAQAWNREKGGGKKDIVVTCTTQTTTCTITGLVPGTTYCVDVFATNGKDGKESSPRVAVTPYAQADQLAGTVYFTSTSDQLTDAARAELDAMVPLFANAAAVRVDGYVQRAKPGQGQPASQLSKRRAIAVANYIGALITAQGWDVVITVRGRGQPAVDPGKTTARRAELIIIGTR